MISGFRSRMSRGGARGFPEMSLLAAVALLFVVGAGVELVSGEVALPDPVVPETEFHESTVFCPPSADRASERPRAERPDRSVATSPLEGDTSLGLERAGGPVESEPDPEGDLEIADVAGDDLIVEEVFGPAPLNLVAYGPPVLASEFHAVKAPVEGIAAAACAPQAAREWFFASGTAEVGFDQRIVVYNPFPDDAVVRITVFTPTGDVARAGLSEEAVPGGEVLVVKLNQSLEAKGPPFAAAVEAGRGRVVAWKTLWADSKDRPTGVQMSFGATEPAPRWYFPEGMLAEGYDQQLALLNPSETKEAVVSISLTTAEKPLQPPELVEIEIPPRSSKTLSFARLIKGSARETGGISATVSTTNDANIVAERALWYDDVLTGTTSELGATTVSSKWWLPPATAAPESDFVSVMNPSADAATLSLTLIPVRGEVITPAKLSAIELKPGGRTKIPLGEWTRDKTFAVILDSDGEVVAERTSSSATYADVSSVMGVPVP